MYINENRFACWNDNDKVLINGKEYSVTATDATRATISGVENKESYTAAYPADLTTGCNDGVVTMTIDPVQTYEVDESDKQKIKTPMVGYTEDNTLAFHNVASLVRFEIYHNHTGNLKMVSIEIKNKNGVNIAGNGSVSNVKTATPTFAVNDGGSSTVNLNFNDEATWEQGNDGASFTLAIAPFSTPSALEISLWAIDNNGKLLKYTKSSNQALSIARNVIAPVGMQVNDNFEEMGSGTQEDPYLIKDEGDLNAMRVMTNKATYSNKYYKLANSINVSSKVWQPFCQTTDFNGTFDGNGCTLTLHLSPKDDYTGLFCRINGATIKNLTLDGTCDENSYSYIGALCGKVLGSTNISKCTNNIAIKGKNSVGGLIGVCSTPTNTTISECVNNANITATSSYHANVGGIVGALGQDNNTSTATFTKCINNGIIFSNTDYEYSIAGGIIGSISMPLTMTDCGNTATIKSGAIGYTAGLVGCSYGYTMVITNCYSKGDINTQSSKKIGGIAIAGDTRCTATITNCYFSGEITGSTANSTYISSIAILSSSPTVANCYALNYYHKGYTAMDPNYYFDELGNVYSDKEKTQPMDKTLVNALNANRGSNSEWTGSPFPTLTW